MTSATFRRRSRARAAAAALGASPAAAGQPQPIRRKADHARRAVRARRRQRHPGARHRAAHGARCWGRPWWSTTSPGAGGNLGTDIVAQARRPTATPSCIASNQVTINPCARHQDALQHREGLRAGRRWSASVPMVLVATRCSRTRRCAEFIALRQGQPRQAQLQQPGQRHAAAPGGRGVRQARRRPRCCTCPTAARGPAIADLIGGQVQLIVRHLRLGDAAHQGGQAARAGHRRARSARR